MILPAKHVRLEESLIGLAGHFIALLATPKSFETLWQEYLESVDRNDFPTRHSEEHAVHAVVLLFALGIVSFDEFGLLTR